MPLFTFLSGLVYAYRPMGPGQALRFAGSKGRRLGVPLVVAATVLYGLRFAAHQRVPPLSQIWTIYVFPYWHLWFVQALLIVFAALMVLESAGALSTFRRYLMVLALALVLFWYAPFERRNVLGVENATYLLPFFLWGLGAHRYRDVLRTRPALIATAVCFVLMQSVHAWVVLAHPVAPIDPVGTRSAWNLLIGFSVSLTALHWLPRLRLLERIGGCSYPIYLYHPLFVAPVIGLAGGVAGLPSSLLFALACAAGIAGPMVMGWAASAIPGGPLLLEGRKLSRRSGGPAVIQRVRVTEASAG
jgi:glucan biosynthesis protein C